MREKDPRLSYPTLRVLRLFADAPRSSRSGADISRAVGLSSGTLYPMLARLEKAGWLMSIWEEDEPNTLGRPRRRLYSITGLGQAKSAAAFENVGVSPGAASWAR